MHAEGSAGQSGVIVRCQAAARCQAARGAHTEGAETGAGGQAGPGVGVGHGGWAGGQDNQREVMHPNISTQSLRPRPYEQGSQHLQRPAAAQYHHPNVSQPGFQPQLSSHAGLSVGQSLTNTQLVHEPGLNIGGREREQPSQRQLPLQQQRHFPTPRDDTGEGTPRRGPAQLGVGSAERVEVLQGQVNYGTSLRGNFTPALIASSSAISAVSTVGSPAHHHLTHPLLNPLPSQPVSVPVNQPTNTTFMQIPGQPQSTMHATVGPGGAVPPRTSSATFSAISPFSQQPRFVGSPPFSSQFSFPPPPRHSSPIRPASQPNPYPHQSLPPSPYEYFPPPPPTMRSQSARNLAQAPPTPHQPSPGVRNEVVRQDGRESGLGAVPNASYDVPRSTTTLSTSCRQPRIRLASAQKILKPAARLGPHPNIDPFLCRDLLSPISNSPLSCEEDDGDLTIQQPDHQNANANDTMVFNFDLTSLRLTHSTSTAPQTAGYSSSHPNMSPVTTEFQLIEHVGEPHPAVGEEVSDQEYAEFTMADISIKTEFVKKEEPADAEDPHNVPNPDAGGDNPASS